MTPTEQDLRPLRSEKTNCCFPPREPTSPASRSGPGPAVRHADVRLRCGRDPPAAGRSGGLRPRALCPEGLLEPGRARSAAPPRRAGRCGQRRRDPPRLAAGYAVAGHAAADRLHGRHLRRRGPRPVRGARHPRELRLARHDRAVRPPRARAGRSRCGSIPASATATAARRTPAATSRSTASGTSRSASAWKRPPGNSRRHRPAHAHRLGHRPGALSQVCAAMEKAAWRSARRSPRSAPAAACRRSIAPGDAYVDLAAYFALWDAARKRLEDRFGHAVGLEIEPGRYLVAESGYLVAEIRAVKRQGEHWFYLLDAGFNNLARPILYGSYHPMSIVPRGGGPPRPDRVNLVLTPVSFFFANR